MGVSTEFVNAVDGTTSHFLPEDGLTNRALTLTQAVYLITSFAESKI
jgi:hypothetical protein